MRLGILFVITLAVSVILGSLGSCVLAYSEAFEELQDLSNSFLQLVAVGVEDFRQLVAQLIGGSSMLIAGILDTVHELSSALLEQMGQQFLQTMVELTVQVRNSSAQNQEQLFAVMASFDNFIQAAIGDFQAVRMDYAFNTQVETALRVQALFVTNVQNRILAIQRQARLGQLSLLNFSRPVEMPLDDGSYLLLAELCMASAELGLSLYLGTALGVHVSCATGVGAITLVVQRGATSDYYRFFQFAPYAGDNYSAWKQSCQVNYTFTSRTGKCQHGVGMRFPDACNGTCGYDPRCRPWYVVQDSGGTPKTQKSGMYTDAVTGNTVVTLSYPIFSSPSQQLVAVAANDFSFGDIDTVLRNLGPVASQQAVAVIFNSSDFLVVGTNRGCPNGTGKASGKPITESCCPLLQRLGKWLTAGQSLTTNASVELNDVLWEILPSTVDSFSFFVLVGVNKSEVFTVTTAASLAANTTRQAISWQQSAQLSALGASVLTSLGTVLTESNASLRATQVALEEHSHTVRNWTEQQINASRQQSTDDLGHLVSDDSAAIHELKSVHLSHTMNSIGIIVAAMVGIFIFVLLAGAYNTWSVTKQVHHLAQVMEDVVQMRVEELQVTQKSFVKEVQQIEAALGMLVRRLAEYKSYIPAGLFPQPRGSPPFSTLAPTLKEDSPALWREALPPPRISTMFSGSSASASSLVAPVSASPSVNHQPRLLRRSVAVMVVNVVRFQAEAAQHSAAQLEAMLNCFIATVHSVVSKVQGNIDVVAGDQLLITFGAHFNCSDPPIAASTVALEVVAALQGESRFGTRAQIGVTFGPVLAGHVGYTPFKTMLAVGAPMKVASLLAHLSGFEQPTVLVCPSVEERVKYHFTLQPVDLVALPVLGRHVPLFSRSISVFLLEAHARSRSCDAPQEWMYEVSVNECHGDWTATFSKVVKAETVEKATEDLGCYLLQHPDHRLARRLLGRLAHWQPQVGIVLAEQPDAPRVLITAHPACTSSCRRPPTCLPSSSLQSLSPACDGAA